MRFEEDEVLVKNRFEEIKILKFCGNHTNVVSEISPGSWGTIIIKLRQTSAKVTFFFYNSTHSKGKEITNRDVCKEITGLS